MEPISIETKPGTFRVLWTLEDLAEVMLTWPRGNKRTIAMKACIAALEETGSPDKARQCFLEAAKEAGAFVREGEFPFKRPGIPGSDPKV